jgi:hypothetical protein
VGFEAAVSAATGELRAGVAGERDAAAGLRRAIAVLRGEVARSCGSTARMQAELDAARSAFAAQATELAALQQVVSDLRCDLAGAAVREELRRQVEAADAVVADAAVADAIARKVATPLTTAAASAYLRACGFPAGSQPAGITWSIDIVPADHLTASSVWNDGRTVHPTCRLLFMASSECFLTMSPSPAGEWVCVDLGGERSVVGALVQSYEGMKASAEGDLNSWFRHKFQWSADGAAWNDVDGGRVWSRDGLGHKDVSAAVFGAPVRCRYLRIVAVSFSGYLRWEVVVLP